MYHKESVAVLSGPDVSGLPLRVLVALPGAKPLRHRAAGSKTRPAGDFDAHFTFAQTLSESVKLVDNALLVVSIPASQNEIGGDGGQAALIRLKNIMQRVETSWRPATAEESFEIVRRRLFQQLTDPEALKARDVVIRSFVEEYRKNAKEFPEEANQANYERRMQRACPVHPELFDPEVHRYQ